MFPGYYTVIVHQKCPFSFDCEVVSKGTSFTAEIDKDRRQVFLDFTFPEQHVSDAHGMLVGTVRGTIDIHSDDPWLRIEGEKIMRRRPKNDGKTGPWIAGFLKGVPGRSTQIQ